MAYDSGRGRVILFGGADESEVGGETWEWDGRRWVENRAALTQGRFNCVMAYDSARRKVIRFGGRYAGKPTGDTWGYDGKRWAPLTPSGPPARNHTAMAYDSKREMIVLFGGHDFGLREAANVFGDTWGWDSDAWCLKGAVKVIRRTDNRH